MPRLEPGPGPVEATFRRPARGGPGGRLLLGVCAGLARRWDLRPRTVRLVLAVTLVPFGAGLLVYAALALVMPADGASEADAGRRSELGRSLQQALVVLAAVFAVALVGGAAAALAVFGLGALALLLATACLAAVIVLDDRRTWLLGVATLALAGPAAAVELTDTKVARQVGPLRVVPIDPTDVASGGYRSGLGPLLVDLRGFDADNGTTTTIRARADLRSLVVALPTDRCFNLEIDYARERTWVSRAVDAAGNPTAYLPSAPGYPGGDARRGQPEPEPWGTPSTLVAYGRAYPGAAGRYRRPSPDRASPTLRLRLQTGRSQIIVRDFPSDVAPLLTPTWPADPAPSLERIDRDLGRSARTTTVAAKPVIQIELSSGTTVVNGRIGDRAVRSAVRDLTARSDYPGIQARQLAGACASKTEVRRIRSRLTRAQLDEERRFASRRAVGDRDGLLVVAERSTMFRRIARAGAERP